MAFFLQIVNIPGPDGLFSTPAYWMSVLRDAMRSAALLEEPDYWSEEDNREEIEEYLKYQETVHQDVRAKDPQKIPGFKFGEYLGPHRIDVEGFYDWHLVPEECHVLAHHLSSMSADRILTFYEHKRKFLRGLGYEGEVLEARVSFISMSEELDSAMEHIQEFAAFCERAAENGGFRLLV